MIKSLRTTQIAFFRFATPCGFFRGSGDGVQKVSVQGFVQEKILYETICENIVSRYQTLVSSLPRMTVFRHRRPKTEFMTGLARQPSKEGKKEKELSKTRAALTELLTVKKKKQCKRILWQWMNEITWKHSIMWMVLVTFSKLPPYRSFSHDVTAAIFVYKTMNWRQQMCTKKVLWEMNPLHMLKLSFTPSNLQSCWPRDWKRSIKPCLSRIYFHHSQNAHVSPS